MNESGKRIPKVFIVEHQPFDYSPASTYGEFVVLKADKLAPNAPDDDHNSHVVKALRHQMATYEPGFDYVIPTGMPSRIMLIGILMKERASGKTEYHNILGWDARTSRYLNYKVKM